MTDYSNVRCQGKHFIPRGPSSVLVVRCGKDAEFTVNGMNVCRWHVRYAEESDLAGASLAEVARSTRGQETSQ